VHSPHRKGPARMISTLLRISRISLRRDRVAQTMIFVLPIAFFSIFASVFGRSSMSSMSRIAFAVVDEDHSAPSQQLVTALKADPALRVRDSVRGAGMDTKSPPVPVDHQRASDLVRAGDFPLALVIPKGWGATFPSFDGRGMQAEVLADPSDPVAQHLFVGILQRAGARVMRGEFSGGAASTGGTPSMGGALSPSSPSSPPADIALVRTKVTDLLGDHRQGRGRMISFYAAGVAVMFLLFSCSAAGGALLDEQDSGTLERVLNTNVGMNGLLAGKWLHL